jgi:hypothetical protein
MSFLKLRWVGCMVVVIGTAATGCGGSDQVVEEPLENEAPITQLPTTEDEPPPPETGPGAVIASISRSDGSPYWPAIPRAVLLPAGCSDIPCAVQFGAQPATGRIVAEAEAGTYSVALYWNHGGGVSPTLHPVMSNDAPLTTEVRAQRVTDLGTIAFDMPENTAATIHGRAVRLHSNEPLAGFDIRIGIMVCEEPREQVIAGTATACSGFMTSTDMVVRTDTEGNFEFPNMNQWSYYLYHGQQVPVFTGVYGTKQSGDALVIPTQNQRSVHVGDVYFDSP